MNRLSESIRSNGAMPDRLLKLFSRRKNMPAAKVLRYAEEWYAITETFGLAAASYLAVIVAEIQISTGKRRLILEELLQRSAAISSDDLGLFRGACGDSDKGPIHFRLFERMCKKLGPVAIPEKDLLPETLRLRHKIDQLFQTLTGGIAVFRVVEPIAYKIVEHQLPLFLAARRDSSKVYRRKELDYILLHLEIEGEHAEESAALANLLLESGGKRDDLRKDVEDLSRLFGYYWRAIERHVLG